MQPPLTAQLLLDAQSELARAADAVPEAAREVAGPGQNAPAWTVAHAAFFLDVWLNVDAQGQGDEACDPWLLAWSRAEPPPQTSPATGEGTPVSFAEGRAALDRAIERATTLLDSLTDADLERVPPRIVENGMARGDDGRLPRGAGGGPPLRSRR